MKLFWKIYLTALAFMVLSVVMLATLLSVGQAQRVKEHLRKENLNRAQLAACQVETGYFEKSWPFELLKTISDYDPVVLWRVVDDNEHIVLSGAGEPYKGLERSLALPTSIEGSQPQLIQPAEDMEGYIIPLRMRNQGRSWMFQLVYHTRQVKGEVLQIIEVNALLGLAVAMALFPALTVVSRRLVRLLQRLAGAASQINSGSLDVSLPSGGSDELGQLVNAFNAMAQSIQLRDAEIKDKVRSLELANAQIQQAQADLLQSERMSMVGQLAAGVAHEINTPTGAIINVASEAVDHLHYLPRTGFKCSRLPEATQHWLNKMIQHVVDCPPASSEASTRAERRQLEAMLVEQMVPQPRKVAALIVQTSLQQYLDLPADLEHLRHEAAIELLEHFSVLHVSNTISVTSAKKIARIVRALKFCGRSNDSVGELDINESIDNTLVILHNRLKHMVEVKLSLGSFLPPVSGTSELSQIWTNLLNNACDAIEEARQGDQMGWIEIVSRQADDMVVVEITNSGPPIPPDIISKVFDPFFTTKPLGKGTGLGLSICRGIVGRMEGALTAANSDHGVRFTVTLPACKTVQPTA